MKKILAVIGSPRKGETYKAVSKFEEELKKTEAVEVEYLMLSELKFADCTGCHSCILKGQSYCREAQKVEGIINKMLAADAVILATPVYNQHVTALMKKFLDYLTYLWHRPAMFGVKFFGLSTGGGMFGGVFKFLKSNVNSWGGIWMGSLGVPHYEALTPKYKKKCDDDFKKSAGQFLMKIGDKALPKPSFGQLMMFNVWKMNAVACKESNPADYEWWTGHDFLNKSYYYEIKIGFPKRLLLKLVTGIARSFMRKVYIGY